MARVDAPRAPVDREGLKREIREELGRESRRKQAAAYGGCLLAALIVFGVPALWIASIFARTGFVEIPGLTAWLYAPSEPERRVLPLGGSTSQSVLRNIATRSSYDMHTSLLTIEAKEDELTTLMQHGVWEAPKGVIPFAIREAQVAVDPDMVEVFVISPRSHREATILVRFRPIVKDDGTIDVDIVSMRIGSLDVPKAVAHGLVRSYGAFVLDALRAESKKAGTLINIVPAYERLDFVVAPNLPK